MNKKYKLTISKLKSDKINDLIEYLISISNEILFTTYHSYHLEESDATEILNEYKKMCIDEHRELKEAFNRNDHIMLSEFYKGNKGLNKDELEETFNDYISEIFQLNMQQSKKIEDNLDVLIKEEKNLDYTKVFPEIANDYVEFETHMFDSFTNYLMPIDLVVYKASHNIANYFKKTNDLYYPIIYNETEKVYFFNPVFVNGEQLIAAIWSEGKNIFIVLDENQYKNFKKLRIKHKKEYYQYEEKL